jgi:hypothetical protein
MMPKFSVKDLLFSMTLMALGFGACWLSVHPPEWLKGLDQAGPFLWVLNWMMVGMLIGAGIGRLFRRTGRGVWLGFILGAVIFLIIIFFGWLSWLSSFF